MNASMSLGIEAPIKARQKIVNQWEPPGTLCEVSAEPEMAISHCLTGWLMQVC